MFNRRILNNVQSSALRRKPSRTGIAISLLSGSAKPAAVVSLKEIMAEELDLAARIMAARPKNGKNGAGETPRRLVEAEFPPSKLNELVRDEVRDAMHALYSDGEPAHAAVMAAGA